MKKAETKNDDYKSLKKALDLARRKHDGQKDKAGDDYIFHPITVALQCKSVEAKTVALLHDVLEDSDTSTKELEELGFDWQIIEALSLLNHDKSQPYEEYIKKIKESGNRLAVEVKLADLTTNMDTGRLGGNKPPKYELYKWAYDYLKGDGEYIFFWKEDEENGFLSNWYKSEFEEDGFIYHSVEQYIMAKKAKLFNDAEYHTAILKAETPKECKELGRKVRNFDSDVWDENKDRILMDGLYLKFTQDYSLQYRLMKLADHKFAEASPFDRIYGIGLSADKARNADPKDWPGENHLGKALKKTAIRILYEADPDYYPGKRIYPPHSSFEAPVYGYSLPEGTKFKELPGGRFTVVLPGEPEESSVTIKHMNITDAKTDIIVNAANKYLSNGSGVCGAIFDAAGAKELEKACSQFNGCPTGSAVITPGFNLCKYIIHAVGPVWQGGDHNERKDLYSCYEKSLDLAKEYNCHSITFPLISSGIYRFPTEDAWQDALMACYDWIRKNESYAIRIEFVNNSKETVETGREIEKLVKKGY